MQIYLTRWKTEGTFRFIKRSYNLEDIRVMKYQRLKNLVTLVTAVGFFGIPPFRFYALADGIRRVLFQGAFSPPETPSPSLQMELTLGWEG